MEQTTRTDTTTNTFSAEGGYPGGSTGEPRRLYRTEGPVSGVSGGLADYFKVDASLVRLAIAAGSIVAFPAVPLAYAAAWLIVPEANPAPVPPIMTPQPPAPTGNPVPPVPTDTVEPAAPVEGSNSAQAQA
jgi:phage shock protein PspC (stress-responsive transcriptional regulator)